MVIWRMCIFGTNFTLSLLIVGLCQLLSVTNCAIDDDYEKYAQRKKVHCLMYNSLHTNIVCRMHTLRMSSVLTKQTVVGSTKMVEQSCMLRWHGLDFTSWRTTKLKFRSHNVWSIQWPVLLHFAFRVLPTIPQLFIDVFHFTDYPPRSAFCNSANYQHPRINAILSSGLVTVYFRGPGFSTHRYERLLS